MLAAQKKTIDGVEFTVVPLPALEAIRLKAYLVRLFGPALAHGFAAMGSLDNPMVNLDGGELSQAIESLVARLDEKTFEDFIRRMLRGVSAITKDAAGTPVVVSFEDGPSFDLGFNLTFQGRTFSLYPLIAFILGVNFPDFSKAVPLFGNLRKAISGTAEAGSDGKSSSENLETSESSVQR